MARLVQYRVKSYPSRLAPSNLRNLLRHARPTPPTKLLLVVPVASPELLTAARIEDVSVIVSTAAARNGVSGHLMGDDGRFLRLHAGPDRDALAPTPRRRGPVPWTTFAVAMEYLDRSPAKQADIAEKLHVTQGGRFAALRSYVSTVRKNGAGVLDAITDLLAGEPWLPAIN